MSIIKNTILVFFYYTWKVIVLGAILNDKLNEFENDSAYWYFTKQGVTFDENAYYATDTVKEALDAGSTRFGKFNHYKRNYRYITNNIYLGLLTKDKTKVTEAGEEAYSLFSKAYILGNNQIEKFRLYFPLTNKNDDSRIMFDLYPTFALYKCLLLLNAKGEDDDNVNPTISSDEFNIFVCRIKNYNECDSTVDAILEYRKLSENDKTDIKNKYSKIVNDNSRIKMAFKNLLYIDFDSSGCFNIPDYNIGLINNKVNEFENSYEEIMSMNDEKYLEMLQSSKSLFDFIKSGENNKLINDESKVLNGSNEIYYGAPGTGKSYMVNESLSYNSGDDLYDKFVFRTTFYEDYSYLDFVGEVKPDTFNDDIGYSFVPGIFTKSLKRAIDNPEKEVYLIIEELTRGNAEAVFGDIFQLLDRDDNGKSVYGIDNANVAKYVFDDEYRKVFIPSNLFIICTANSSDQNTFVLDTAFKRRFSFNYIDVKPSHNNNFKFIYGNKELNWDDFYMKLNDFIVYNLKLSEDKQIGEWFVVGSKDIKKNTQMVKEKVLNYLWEDVNGLSLINIDADNIFLDEFKTFRDVMVAFDEGREVFNNKLMDNNNE